MATSDYSAYLINIPYIAEYRTYANSEDIRQDFRSKNIRYLFGNNILDTTENKSIFPQICNKELITAKNGLYIYRVVW